MGIILQKPVFKHWREFQQLVDQGSPPSCAPALEIFKYIPSESLEGYLFPDTYNFFPDASAESMAEVMLNRFESVVGPFWDRSGAADAKRSLHEILTLASIVEKRSEKAGGAPDHRFGFL